MKCPVCDVPLSISSREGVEIDFCPQCRGVWLDRGELDKIIERNAEFGAQSAPAPAPQQAPPQSGSPWGAPPPQQQQPYGYGHGYHGKPYKRRKSFLEELFD